jgi:hypothetical protein
MVACHIIFNKVIIGRNFYLAITKKPHAYEKNTLFLPNAVGEASWEDLLEIVQKYRMTA